MEQVYVTGHRNPDTDSIVSAMAYAALHNALGDREYVAARLGHVSDETKLVLDRFGFQPPIRIKTMRTQVRDLEFDTPPALSAALTIRRGWSVLQSDAAITAIPVTDEEGGLFGMLSSGDVAGYDMETISDPTVRELPLYNLLSVLEGRLVRGGDTDTVSGQVVLALPTSTEKRLFDSEDYVAIVGNEPEIIRWALEANVRCLILCQTEPDPALLSIESETCVICTPFDAYRAARLIFQATPISRICQTEGLISFHLDDFLDDVREAMSRSRYRCYPVLDEQERVVGTVSRYHLIKPRRKKVVLMDHNEVAQSVPGLDQAEILAIIDHHRLADIQTLGPVYFRNEVVGSTTTIVAEMFRENGMFPPARLAGLMCAAILSDTVLFKSPTATQRDREIAERLARLAGISLDELGREIFSASNAENRTAESLLYTDFKEFHIAGHYLGVGQITCVDSAQMLRREGELLAAMEQAKKDKEYDMVILMLTDVLLEGTQLLFVGKQEDISQAFNLEPKGNLLFLPGVMSRKKQVIPMLSALWG